MRIAAICLLLALAACGEAESARDAAPAADVLIGDYRAASNTAHAITGDLAIERGGLMFAKGVILYTRTLEPRRGGDLTARNGATYAAAALGPGDLVIELRRVTEQIVPEGGVGLCGASRPQYVALAHQGRATSVTVLVFSGDEPPGPDALNSNLCATYNYHAPDGARTREGVVL